MSWEDEVAEPIERYRDGIPRWLAWGWIAAESGGDLGDDTEGTVSGGEHSLYQLTTDDLRQTGADLDRMVRDWDYSVFAGLAMVARKADVVASKIGRSSDDTYWRWAKYVHSIGTCGFHHTIDDLIASGVDVWDWDAVTAFYAPGGENDLRVSAAIHADCGNPHQPSNAIRRVDKAYQLGAELAASHGGSTGAGGGGGLVAVILVAALIAAVLA